MVKYYSCEDEGLVEMAEWQPHYWISVQCPTASDAELLDSLGVPPSFMESVADIDERPRFDREDGWLLTIIRIPHRVRGGAADFVTIPMGVMTKDDIIITLCHYETEMVADFIEYCNRRHVLIDNQPDFVLRLLYSSTFWFLQYLKDIKATVAEATRDIQRSVRNQQLLNLMRQQNALVYFNTSIQGNSMLTERLNNVFIDDCNADLLEDVEIEM
ncbi:MAG: magnesium transporter CorA family protein, partial [Lachnospiraceae bacterium]|nr:magnesium transporter CorA family protein [Lachnospiraceae bacterium]